MELLNPVATDDSAFGVNHLDKTCIYLDKDVDLNVCRMAK